MDRRGFYGAYWEWTKCRSLVNIFVILGFCGIWRSERSSGDHHSQLEPFESLLWRSLYHCLHFQRFFSLQFEPIYIKFHHWQYHVHSFRTYQYFDYRQLGLPYASDAASLVTRLRQYHCSRNTWNEPIRVLQPERAPVPRAGYMARAGPNDFQRGCNQL